MPAESARHVAIGMVRTTIRRRQGAKLGLQIFQSKSSGLRGVSISAIDSGSVAEDAGLRVNDVITMVGVSAPIEICTSVHLCAFLYIYSVASHQQATPKRH